MNIVWIYVTTMKDDHRLTKRLYTMLRNRSLYCLVGIDHQLDSRSPVEPLILTSAWDSIIVRSLDAMLYLSKFGAVIPDYTDFQSDETFGGIFNFEWSASELLVLNT
ncbi:hypothetical protein RF11_11651 [Thelohanellus kitauei]|uniref:Uncharacterized protein n=1 Tax=Thelohanellus kitauei TaxID=669202 RepID=A0A0C2MNH3_THEKT|nr:hypothetical protein RF11_11651 [Thelohanellus kitauei]